MSGSGADVIVIGAGLAGLCCARALLNTGLEPLVLEACDTIGGRVRSERVGGFTLDRGFQVFLAAYPAAREELDYADLDLRAFLPAAGVMRKDGLRLIADPRRAPGLALRSLRRPAVGLGDALALFRMHRAIMHGGPDAAWSRPEKATFEALREAGIAGRPDAETLLRSFFGGVFFDRDLRTSRRMFEFTYRMFASGPACVPSRGMSAIPEQLARPLGDRVRVRSRVGRIAPGRVRVVEGGELSARAIVIATEGSEALRLLDAAESLNAEQASRAGVAAEFAGWRATVTVYFEAPKAPIPEAMLLLDGEGTGPCNHLAVMTNAAPSYGPGDGRALIAANVVGDRPVTDDELEAALRRQLSAWFGPQVDAWRAIKTYRIAQALPTQFAGNHAGRSSAGLEPPRRPVRVIPGVYVAGDHRDNASINGAMESGRRAAQAVIEDLAGKRHAVGAASA